MCRPFRNYCYMLAEKLGMSVKRLLTEMDSNEIAEWMAFDLSRTEEFQERWEKEKSKNLSDQEYAARFKALLGR